MYLLFGLLLIYFSSIHGRMIQCFVGGIVKYDGNHEIQEQYCNTLVKESFLHKSYIILFGILLKSRMDEWNQILNMEIDTHNVDLPVIIQKGNPLEFYSGITRNAGLKPIQNSAEFHETYSMKLLHMDKSIVEYWDDIVQMGTDMHRLKFHGKLLSLYNNQPYTFTPKEMIVFFQSSYSVYSIYNLTNNVLMARSIEADTQCIVNLFSEALYNRNTSTTDKLEVATWQLLFFTEFYETIDLASLSLDHHNSLTYEHLDILEKFQLYSLAVNNYPCSYLFMFRRVLLDQNPLSNIDEWIKYATLLKDDKIIDCDNHPDNNKIKMYSYILLSIYDPEFEEVEGLTSLNHLLLALKLPVFTSEDRLINYKVTSMAMNKIIACVSVNSMDVVWVEYANGSLCNTLKNFREHDNDLDNILTKLTYMLVYEMTNSDSAFYTKYRNENGKIDEKKLHLIVTIGLDNMNNNFDLSLKRVNIIQRTINVLEQYVASLQAPKTIKYTMKLQYEQKVEYYIELMRTYKWLAELYGILCTDSNNRSTLVRYQKGLEKSLIMAITIQREYTLEDDHLEFLFYKKICKDSQLSYSWESHYKPDGWIQKLPNHSEGSSRDSIFHQGHNCLQVSKFLGIDNQFIHQADVNILIFKHLMKEHSYDDSVSTFVKNALTHLVVTSEDRVRNLQAHDLFSMYFVWRNYRLAKEEENK